MIEAGTGAVPGLCPFCRVRAYRRRRAMGWRPALPVARLVEVPGAGHLVQEDAPEAIMAALADFAPLWNKRPTDDAA